MPTYEFRCESCDQNFERFLKIVEMDIPLSNPCPECSSGPVKRVVSGATYAFMSPESLGRKKAPGDFRNWLSAVKKVNKGSTIKDH